MCKSDLFDEFELRVLRKGWNGFGHSEHGADDVVR